MASINIIKVERIARNLQALTITIRYVRKMMIVLTVDCTLDLIQYYNGIDDRSEIAENVLQLALLAHLWLCAHLFSMGFVKVVLGKNKPLSMTLNIIGIHRELATHKNRK